MPLQIVARTASPDTLSTDVIVVGVFASPASKKRAGVDGPMAVVDRVLEGALAKLAAKEDFVGKREQVLSVPTLGKGRASRVVLIGLGDPVVVSDADLRTFGAKAARAANADKAQSLVIALPAGLERRLRPIAEGVTLGSYRFDKYLTGDRRPKAKLAKVTLALTGKLTADGKRQVDLGAEIGEAINLTRDLGNEPPNVITPVGLAAAAQAVAKRAGLKIKVFDFKEIQRRGMKLLQAVGQGSRNEPRFVHMTYTPARKPKKVLVFVGKGITFDSGGLSIKPAAGMGEMKSDMSGAGNMVGFMAAVAALKPNVEVHAIMACAENMPDGNAYRPGDIWGSLDGKTVEIINTDAEGRLILADALAYAREIKSDLLVDNATLTGACVVALGPSCTGFYASNEEVAATFSSALKTSGEQMWRMPLLEDLREHIKSDVADVKQLGDRYGGSITAALFLREFIGDTKNWIHADIAGPAFADRVLGWSPKGATGHGILTFLSLVEQASA